MAPLAKFSGGGFMALSKCGIRGKEFETTVLIMPSQDVSRTLRGLIRTRTPQLRPRTWTTSRDAGCLKRWKLR